MTVLEASLRKLVREEANSAAVETIDHVQEEIRDGLALIRGDLKAIANEEFALSMRRLTTWSRMNVPRPEAVAEYPAQGEPGSSLIEWRQTALNMAMAITTGDELFPLAEKFARFLIDGCLDGNPRPITELPPIEQEETA